MEHALNGDRIRVGDEADAVIAHAETKLFGVAFEFLNIAFAGLGKALKRGKDAHGGGNIAPPDIGAGLFGEGDLLHAPLFLFF
jgi:hypothetical protein